SCLLKARRVVPLCASLAAMALAPTNQSGLFFSSCGNSRSLAISGRPFGAAHPTQKNDFDKVIALDTTWLVQVLFEGVFDGIDSSLSAHLILVGGAAADADPADMHLVLGHNRQSASERNDSRNQRKPWHHAPLEILAVGELLNTASGERKSR